jgi:hypothetical protein
MVGLSIATTALVYADPCELNPGLVGLRALRRELDDLEAASCGLLQMSGVSWDAMASWYQVSRQSLHRRLSPKIDSILRLTGSFFEDDLERNRSSAGVFLRHLEDNLDAELGNAPHALKELRRRPGWWHQDHTADAFRNETGRQEGSA